MMKNRTTNIIFLVIVSIVVAVHIRVPVSGWVYAAIAFTYLMIQLYGSANLSAQFFVPVKSSGNPSAPCVALTFDDGPIPGKTESVLDILRMHGISATFFCIGHRVKQNPELAKRITIEGHILANHSFWHGKLFDLQTTSKITDELTATDSVIHEHTGLTPRFFRPPYGVTNPMVSSAIKQKGYVTVGWSIRSFDTLTKDSAKLLKHITGSLKGGDIILLHDYSETMIQILPALLKAIQNLGLKVVRVDELLNERPYV